jgi:hypothetical protein
LLLELLARALLKTGRRCGRRATRERMLRRWRRPSGGSPDQPLILVLEDLHWSDYSTVDLVATARRDPTRLMVIGTYRPVEMIAAIH